MHNPLRSEAEAFRWLVVILAGALTVIGLTLLTRPLVGAIWALVLIVAGLALALRGSRGTEHGSLTVTRGGDGRHRVLALANQTVRSPALLEQLAESTRERRAEIRVVVPALPGSRAELWASDTDEATELARQRMELCVLDLREAGHRANGAVGDSDPSVALADALAEYPADEIVISTLPPGRSRWLDERVVERAREELSLPVRHLVWDPEAKRATPG